MVSVEGIKGQMTEGVAVELRTGTGATVNVTGKTGLWQFPIEDVACANKVVVAGTFKV